MTRMSEDIKAIIDIGSNSIRLSLYKILPRLPYLLFSQKSFCGLAEDIDKTGMIKEKNITKAQRALTRFHLLCQSQSVVNIIIIATSAVRDSSNGHLIADFVQELFKRQLQILSGADEAYFSARAVQSFFFQPSGLSVDLGGGSVEFAAIDEHIINHKESFPYGVLRVAGHDTITIEQDIKSYIDAHKLSGQILYLIGGAWRSLARLYIGLYDYPLHILHELRLSQCVFLKLLDRIDAEYDEIIVAYKKIIDKKRLQQLRDIVTIARIITVSSNAQSLVFSASSLRDGILYDAVGESEKKLTALEATAAQILHHQHFHVDSPNIVAEIIKLNQCQCQSQGDRHDYHKIGNHIIKMAVYFSNIAALDHPDYRAREAFERIVSSPIIGINHRERIILALSVSQRYFKTSTAHHLFDDYQQLLDDNDILQARLIGYIMRFYHLITAGMSNALSEECYFDIIGDELRFIASERLLNFISDNEQYYLQKTAVLLNKKLIMMRES